MKMGKKLFFMGVLFIALAVMVVLPNKVSADEMSAEFQQILNEEGKLVVIDTTMAEDKQQFLQEYLGKYATDEYWFGVNLQYDETHYAIALNNTVTNGGEAHDIEVVFEEQIGDAFKSILKDGKFQVPSSTKNGVGEILSSYLYNLSESNENYRIQIAWDGTQNKLLVDENYTKATIKLLDKNWKLLEQHVVELSYLTEQSEDFKKELNQDGKVVFNSIKPNDINELWSLFEMLFVVNNEERGYYLSSPSDDFSSMDLTINYGTVNQETHRVEILYNYDAAINQKLQGFINNFPKDISCFYVKDLELINYWVNNVANDAEEGSENLDAYSGELKAAVNNNNIEYYVDNRAGEDNAFYTERYGIAIFKYNNIIYHLDGFLGTKAENIIYVPDTTGSSKEELIAAAQKRINEYLGKENIVTVSYGGNAYDAWVESMYDILKWMWEQESPDMTLEEFKEQADMFLPPYEAFEEVAGISGLTETDDTFLVTVKVGDKEKSFHILIKKDSSKMVTPSYKTADMATDIEISSASTAIPLDTSIQATQLTSGTEYEKIIRLLDVKENAMFDLKLYSNSLQGYVTKLEDGSFEVRIPMPDNLKDKKIAAYYTDGSTEPEVLEVEVKDGYAVFTTKHFSIYTLAESKSTNNGGTTSDTIVSDTDATITLKDSDKALPEGTTLTSEKLTEGTAFDDIKKIVKEEKTIGEYAVYELNLFDNTHAAIHQLNGKVKVTIDLPITVGEGNKLQVYRVDGNLLVECPTTVSDGKVTFETDHFSTYVIAEIETGIQQKGDGSVYGGYLILLAGIMLAVYGVISRKRIMR